MVNPYCPAGCPISDREGELLDEIGALEANEPECTCRQIDVDLLDPRGCELCDKSTSPWHAEYRRLTTELEGLREAREPYRPAPEDVQYEYDRDVPF